ncbi:MAG: YtxH domain-containing protein [Bacteroidales bacterium]|jgi:gas vesicle protein
MSAGKVLLGVLAGVAVGAALGILLAPDKGTVTRKKIAKKSDDYAEELEAKFEEFIEGITKKFENVKEDAVRMAKKAKHKMEEAEAEMTEPAK